MSCDFGVWFPHRRLSHEAAGALYAKLCEGELDEVRPHPAVDAFYNELTTLYPELDTIPDERIGDHDFCPWSCVIERSPGHLILLCVWSQASRVEALVKELARRHGLSLYDPQAGILHNPDDPPTKDPRRPWWWIWLDSRTGGAPGIGEPGRGQETQNSWIPRCGGRIIR